jgi:hypothetical protein
MKAPKCKLCGKEHWGAVCEGRAGQGRGPSAGPQAQGPGKEARRKAHRRAHGTGPAQARPPADRGSR